MAVNDEKQWLVRLGKLRVDRASGDPAPHKPLLLLAVLDLAEEGLLPNPVLSLTPDLAYRFFTYWSVVAHRRRQPPEVRFPFHHLGSDGVWSPLLEDGTPSGDRRLTRSVELQEGFFALVHDPVAREQARRLLIAKYFPPEERVSLYAMTELAVPSDEQIEQDAKLADREEAEERGREGRFRVRVMTAYGYTCALTGYRLTTIDAGSIVDAAHIHQFAASHNNDLNNGLALSKNAHWLFDAGLWSVTCDYRVVVALGRFSEASPDGRALAEYRDQPLRLPQDRRLWPNPVHLGWHRSHRFRGDA